RLSFVAAPAPYRRSTYVACRWNCFVFCETYDRFLAVVPRGNMWMGASSSCARCVGALLSQARNLARLAVALGSISRPVAGVSVFFNEVNVAAETERRICCLVRLDGGVRGCGRASARAMDLMGRQLGREGDFVSSENPHLKSILEVLARQSITRDALDQSVGFLWPSKMLAEEGVGWRRYSPCLFLYASRRKGFSSEPMVGDTEQLLSMPAKRGQLVLERSIEWKKAPRRSPVLFFVQCRHMPIGSGGSVGDL
ncbi:unnamed protein product, partial [Hapterophycus canaliculatus]